MYSYVRRFSRNSCLPCGTVNIGGSTVFEKSRRTDGLLAGTKVINEKNETIYRVFETTYIYIVYIRRERIGVRKYVGYTGINRIHTARVPGSRDGDPTVFGSRYLVTYKLRTRPAT